jgi:hypothetical protein
MGMSIFCLENAIRELQTVESLACPFHLVRRATAGPPIIGAHASRKFNPVWLFCKERIQACHSFHKTSILLKGAFG